MATDYLGTEKDSHKWTEFVIPCIILCYLRSHREQKFVTERTDVSTGAISGTGTNGQTHPTPEDVSYCVLIS